MQADQTLENLHKLQILQKQITGLCRLIQNSRVRITLGRATRNHIALVLDGCPRRFVLAEDMLRQAKWNGAAQRALLRQTPTLALIVEDEL